MTMAAALAFPRRCRCFLALASSSSSTPLAHATKAQTLTTLAGAHNRRRILLPAPPTSASQAAAAAAPFSTKAPAAKKGKKGGDDAGGGGGGGEAPIGDTSKVAPVNIYKEGKDPPLLPDDQYPEWLFEIRPLTLPEYRKMDVSKLSLQEQRRFWKLLNRQVIKEKNATGQKL